MIDRLQIKNFRSILNCEINFTPLTVIVGANASGKSNLIKAIEFISDSIRFGLQDATYNRGGFSELAPKQIKRVADVRIEFNIEMTIAPPEYWGDNKLPDIAVDYHIAIENGKKNISIVADEALRVNELLSLSSYLKNEFLRKEKLSDEEKNELLNLKDSAITFLRDQKSKIIVNPEFEINTKSLELFHYWLGLDRISQGIDSEHRILSLAKFLVNELKNPITTNNSELILSTNRILEGFSTPFKKLIDNFSSMYKYDLFLNELRYEQNISRNTKVDTEGSNIPSVTSYLLSRRDKSRWDRIMTTMSNISPYFSDAKKRALRAGKEYLIFNEVFKGREIESWEASDGTLRAFAILLALETHPGGATIMIEEPEHGLHPWALREIIKHIREVINERKLQVIITTHSPQILEQISPEELLVAERTLEDGTQFKHVDKIIPNITNMTDIGKLWVTGLLKGVPSF